MSIFISKLVWFCEKDIKGYKSPKTCKCSVQVICLSLCLK